MASAQALKYIATGRVVHLSAASCLPAWPAADLGGLVQGGWLFFREGQIERWAAGHEASRATIERDLDYLGVREAQQLRMRSRAEAEARFACWEAKGCRGSLRNV